MNIIHWVIAVGLGAITLLWSVVLKLLPLQNYFGKGKKKSNILENSSSRELKDIKLNEKNFVEISESPIIDIQIKKD